MNLGQTGTDWCFDVRDTHTVLSGGTFTSPIPPPITTKGKVDHLKALLSEDDKKEPRSDSNIKPAGGILSGMVLHPTHLGSRTASPERAARSLLEATKVQNNFSSPRNRPRPSLSSPVKIPYRGSITPTTARNSNINHHHHHRQDDIMVSPQHLFDEFRPKTPSPQVVPTSPRASATAGHSYRQAWKDPPLASTTRAHVRAAIISGRNAALDTNLHHAAAGAEESRAPTNNASSMNRTPKTTPSSHRDGPPVTVTTTSGAVRANNNQQHNHHDSIDNTIQESSNEIVSDYDRSATVLYELLESSNWEEARNRCRTHPEEVRTWVVRKDKSLKVRWKLLPLHAAIIFQSPNYLIAALLEKYPGAASARDDQGMMPLHLAFRHKQEDEDLLELLLVQYPKAVLLKDRRDRVPLEHGRECKFSAKMMRLYADATVAGSRASGGNASGLPTAAQAASPLASPRTLSRVVDEQQQALQQLRQQHESEMRRLQEHCDDKLRTARERHEADTRQTTLALNRERETLEAEHEAKIRELRDSVHRHSDREKALMRDLQAQISDLQSALDSTRRQRDSMSEQCDKYETFSNHLKEQMQAMIQDQLFIRDLATRQEKELDTARQMRSQIVRTLMQQEDEDGAIDRARTEKMKEMATRVRDRIQLLLDSEPSSSDAKRKKRASAEPPMMVIHENLPSPRHPRDHHRSSGLQDIHNGLSRIELERAEDVGMLLNTQQTTRTDARRSTSKNNGATYYRDELAVLERREDNGLLRKMTSLGDEISAITTDHSR